MNLSAEQLAAILANANNQPGANGHEKRRAPRVPLTARVTLKSSADLNAVPSLVTVKDISCRGVGFMLPQALPPGQQLVVCLPRPGAQPLSLLCTVMHSRALSRDLHAIGAEFVSEIDLSRPTTDQTDDWFERERIKASILL